MNIEAFDHVVLTVADIETTCAFYSRVLGFEVVTYGENRVALQFAEQRINLHQAGHEFEPKAAHPTPGSADLCFCSDTPLKEVIAHLRTCSVDIVEGPVKRTGVFGPMLSLYFRDPDGNLLEVSHYLNHA